LARIEDFFRLLYESLSMFGRFSLARSKVAYWLDELDEQIDMLEFTRRHGSALDATIAELGVHHARRSGSD
jgi:hypothetical protein